MIDIINFLNLVCAVVQDNTRCTVDKERQSVRAIWIALHL